MIEADLYDTEFCYGFDFKFKDEFALKEFLELNPRFEISEGR